MTQQNEIFDKLIDTNSKLLISNLIQWTKTRNSIEWNIHVIPSYDVWCRYKTPDYDVIKESEFAWILKGITPTGPVEYPPDEKEIHSDEVHNRLTSANSIQYGGKHYKQFVIQPWDYIAKNEIPFLEGSAIKYISRWRDKGGIEDLKKAIHFLEKVIELEQEKEKS